MKKVGVFLGSEPYNGGAFQYNQSILDALDALPKSEYQIFAIYQKDLWTDYLKKYTFKMVSIQHNKWKNLFGRVLFRIFRYYNIDISPMKNFYAKVDMFAKKVDGLNLDVVIFPSQEILPAKISSKSIGVIHDLMHRYENRFPEICNDREYAGREFLYKNLCSCSNAILVDSGIGKEHVLECYGDQYKDKIHVVPFTPPQYLLQNNNDNKIEMKLPEKYIFYPAQFWKHKNHKNLILAIKLLKDKNINIRLLLMGSPKNGYDEVISLIKQNNLEADISILGYVAANEMITIYKNARAMIMPTFCGPTNIPPLEGLVLGCPVAVSRVYGMPEQVGDAALTFDPNSIEEIAKVICALWKDDKLCLDLIEKGYKRAKAFEQSVFNKKIKNVIDNVLNG